VRRQRGFERASRGLTDEPVAEIIQCGDGVARKRSANYPALYRLERQALIRSEWRVTVNNRRARYYALTPQGRRHLNQELADWRRMSRAINLVLEATLDRGGA
jgi:PadR family transcriptional regulator PadR